VQSYFPHIWGNEENRARIGAAISAGTLSHAYIIEGPDGSGKRTFAREIAAALACAKRGDTASPLPCGSCPSCRKILADNSADVTYLAPNGATISVDAVRGMRADMYLSSSEEERKVYIIEDAHTMTPQAQNALLIVLEEPPTDLLILLLTDRADALLPTIRSRAQILRMKLLNDVQMKEALASHPAFKSLKSKSEDEYAALLESAGGRLGAILDLLDGKKSEALMQDRATVEKVVTALAGHARYTDLVPAMQLLPTKRAELIPLMALLSAALRDLTLLSRDDGCPLCFYTDRAAARKLAQQAGITHLLHLCDEVERAQNALNMNANVQLTLLTLFTGV
jgi:DNA polymerase-3 subunit delta'